MSQHDMVLDNGPGLAVRTDMNAAIQALASCSGGPIEPTVKYAGQLWLDTTVTPNGQLRQRNLANTAWVDPSFALSASFTAADIGFGARVSPNRFVWNDKADLSGTDVATLLDDGTMTTKTYSARSAANPNFIMQDMTPTNRGQIYQDMATNKMMASIWNVAGGLVHTGEIMTSGNSPFAPAGYAKFANGLILNCGAGSTDASGNLNVTYPTAFPNSLLAIVASAVQAAGTAANVFFGVQVINPGTTQASFQQRVLTPGAVAVAQAGIRWMAMGW